MTHYTESILHITVVDNVGTVDPPAPGHGVALVWVPIGEWVHRDGAGTRTIALAIVDWLKLAVCPAGSGRPRCRADKVLGLVLEVTPPRRRIRLAQGLFTTRLVLFSFTGIRELAVSSLF